MVKTCRITILDALVVYPRVITELLSFCKHSSTDYSKENVEQTLRQLLDESLIFKSLKTGHYALRKDFIIKHSNGMFLVQAEFIDGEMKLLFCNHVKNARVFLNADQATRYAELCQAMFRVTSISHTLEIIPRPKCV